MEVIEKKTAIKKQNSVRDNFFLKKIIAGNVGERVAKFISDQVDLTKEKTIFLSSNDSIYENKNNGQIRTMIDLQVINYKEDLHSYFRHINNSLPDAGIYIGCVESNTERRQRITAGFPRFIGYMIELVDFMIHRVLPKLSLTKKLYNFFTKKKYNVISKAEILGRLSYSGFEIIGHERINNLFYFSVIKTREAINEREPNYGLVFKMNRISKHGKIIGVYKVRTMHPYAEYIQDYVVKLNGYNKAGKPNRDFRLTGWGRVIRKLHLDEIPQLWNVLKGELNLVGVRPLSKFGYKSLPEDLQQERIKYKPGCIPPNVALGIIGFDEVIRAERIYLRLRKYKGFITNIWFFLMAIINLLKRKTISS